MAATKQTPTAPVSDDNPPEDSEVVAEFFENVGVYHTLKPHHNVKDAFSNLIGGLLKVISIQRGKISCLLNVKPPILNGYGGMHGGAVGSVAERVAIACARTVVGKDKDIFLGELSNTYLSPAPCYAEVLIDGSVIRSGRNLTVVAVDFRLKETGKLMYMSRATLYNTPVSGCITNFLGLLGRGSISEFNVETWKPSVRGETMAAGKETPTVSATTVAEDVPPEYYKSITGFFNRMGAVETIIPEHSVKDSYSNLIGGCLKVISIQKGKISCLLNVKDPILNIYGGMHGGAVAAVAERVAIGCARTVVGKDKDIFLGELGISYLSSAPPNTEVVVDGSVIRSGRNLTVITVNFRLKESERLVYMSRATFYNIPVSSL